MVIEECVMNTIVKAVFDNDDPSASDLGDALTALYILEDRLQERINAKQQNAV